MMVLPPFHLIKAASLTEALAALAQNPEALPVAGGTDLLVSMKQGLFHPQVLVDLKGVPELKEWRITGQGIVLGAGLPLSFIRDLPELQERVPALCEAAGAVASPPLQNRGTLGGNICLDTRCWFYNQSAFWRGSRGYCLKKEGTVCQAVPGSKRCFAVCCSDTAPVLMALNAGVRISRWAEGRVLEREVSVQNFFKENGINRNILNPGELVTAVYLPPSEGLLSRYRKYRQRASIDYPLVSLAVALRLREGRLIEVRVALGAMASAPILALETMATLEGARPTPELLGQAAARVTIGTRPVKNQAATPAYRRHMARVLCQNLFQEVIVDKS
jgi:4-hydroxybenzoyl-CoA reductase subunit beta